MSKIAEKFRPPSKTALFEAAKRWNVDAVKTILMAAPALVEASDARGRKALHIACAVKPTPVPSARPTELRLSLLY